MTHSVRVQAVATCALEVQSTSKAQVQMGADTTTREGVSNTLHVLYTCVHLPSFGMTCPALRPTQKLMVWQASNLTRMFCQIDPSASRNSILLKSIHPVQAACPRENEPEMCPVQEATPLSPF